MGRHIPVLRLSAAALAVAAATFAATAVVPMETIARAQSEQVYKNGDSGVVLPQPVKGVNPEYTPEAMQARIQGSVWLTGVVRPNGLVSDVAVAKSLDQEHGLDNQAIRALRQWEFKAGTKDGKPVAVEVTVEFTFTLK
jgi:TonB family protein